MQFFVVLGVFIVLGLGIRYVLREDKEKPTPKPKEKLTDEQVREAKEYKEKPTAFSDKDVKVLRDFRNRQSCISEDLYIDERDNQEDIKGKFDLLKEIFTTEAFLLDKINKKNIEDFEYYGQEFFHYNYARACIILKKYQDAGAVISWIYENIDDPFLENTTKTLAFLLQEVFKSKLYDDFWSFYTNFFNLLKHLNKKKDLNKLNSQLKERLSNSCINNLSDKRAMQIFISLEKFNKVFSDLIQIYNSKQ